ncbi:ComEC/Rec2 family competence protein [uncultured Porphyromonas sp.]|uniref:ComEC/Rec2 family competence protein n=1 Tax=uncultured Porphyromonas sp. TaxID=159274 RepID=UPI002594ABEF|nr:ComEC/Rec2 family competence protein [uncultured Porphyromonas sp.]
MSSLLVPRIEYTHRPAFRLVIGVLLGALIAQSDYLFAISITLVVVIGVLLFYPFKKIKADLLIWTLLIAIAFGLYTHLRGARYEQILQPCSVSHARVKLLYPLIASAESEIRYRAKVELPNGQWINVLLKVPDSSTINEANSYGAEGVAALDLSPLSALKNKGYRKYLISEGIHATATIQSIETLAPMITRPLTSILQHWRYLLRHQFETLASDYIPWEGRGLIYAISLGDRSLLPSSLKRQFTDSGVAHLLALSGYHLGVVAWIASLLIGWALWQYEWRYLRYLLLFIVLLAYTLFSGASTATVRAFLLSALLIGGKVLTRPTDPIQLLSLVFLVFIVINPFAYYSIGLLLSLSAVWGIYSFFPLFKRLLNPTNRLLQWLRDLICLAVAAQIGVLPLLFYNFGAAPLVFIWSNIPLVFISSLLIPLALVAFLLTAIFDWVPSFLLEMLRLMTGWMHSVTSLFSHDPMTLTLQFDSIALALYYLIAYLAYRLLHSYTCRVETARMIHPSHEEF